MAVSVGTLTVDIIRGRPVSLKDRVEVWERDGFDGIGARLNANGHGEFALKTVKYIHGSNEATNKTNAETHIADAAALQGTVVTVEDNWGTTYQNCLVRRFAEEVLNKQKVVYKGDANAIRIELGFELVRTA